MIKFTKYLLLALALSFAFPSFAVSDKEMEEARTIAAKLYLRWSNDGSGYLDDVSAKTMSQLEASLKPKEKENLKAFKAVKVPSDYASWDKARLVEFWGVTFFTSPGLSESGKRAKGRVKNKVQAMKVSAPEVKKEEPKPADAQAKPEEKPALAETPEEHIPAPSAQAAAEKQEDILADQTAIAEAEAEAEATAAPRSKGSNKTWIYVAILVVLIGVVIWLMVFAANMLKKQGPEDGDEVLAADNDRLAKSERAAKSKLADTEQRMKALEESNAELQREISRLTKRLEESRANEERLRADLASAKAGKGAAAIAPAAAPQAPRREQAQQPAKKPVINEIYLGRANAKGQFVRGDRRPVAGNTVFRLDTTDGMVGTFRLADNADAMELALSNPLQYLAGACNSDNYADAATATRIVTEDPGTAILEGGCWKVLRKSRIRFE